MSRLFTRQDFRDRIRRKLQIIPPVDYFPTPGNPGDQPVNAPVPTNANLNDALQDAISDVNRECQFHVTQFAIPLAAVSQNILGPLGIALGSFLPNTSVPALQTPLASVNDVLRALWTPTGSTPQLLLPVNRNALDRGGISSYYSDVPSVPQQWYIEGYSLYLDPAPASPGTLTLTCGSGVVGLQGETDVLDQVPIDFQSVFEDRAVYRWSITQTMDVEASERAAMYGPMSAQGISRFKAWKEGQSGVVQPQMGFMTYRNGYGLRRTRR